MTPDYDYGLVTRHRWLWPIIDIAAVLFIIARDTARKYYNWAEARHRPMD